MKTKISSILITCLVLFSCTTKKEDKTIVTNVYTAKITELNDSQYPDNPDISIRHDLDGTFSHLEVNITPSEKGYTFTFLPGNFESDTLTLKDIQLLEYIPSAPEWIKKDDYLTYIGIVNQEWNRQQVKYFQEQFEFTGKNKESKTIKRVDLARNCLNAYLWEIIAYAENGEGQLAPVYHGWFDFPEQLYAQLFNERNNLDYEKYKAPLENWITPSFEKINFDLLRDVTSEKEISFESLNDTLYPLIGERKKKRPNIVAPKTFESINNLLNDSTQYATFTPPGYYNTSDPRKTELSRFQNLKKATLKSITAKNSDKTVLKEIELTFTTYDAKTTTKLTIGGLDLDKIDSLTLDTHHKGFQMPMGIANHSFYETYKKMISSKSLESPYYGLLTNDNDIFIDSHDVGIDGPLFWVNQQTGKLHLMILSFERHSFVGHFALDI